MKKLIFLLVAAAVMSVQTLAETTVLETAEGFDLKVSGVIDIYYLYNQNGYNLKPGADSASSDDDYDRLTYRNYDDTHSDIVLNLFELTFQGQYKFLSFYADLDFGNFAEQNAAESDDGATHHIGQAYLRYSKGPMEFSVGKMYTNIGYESPKAIDNWNTSRSFAYMIGTPTWHEGISIKHSYANGVHWALFAYDSFDAQRSDNNDQKTASLQIGYEADKLSWVLNSMAGNESDRKANSSRQSALTQIHHAAVQYDPDERWSFALTALYAHDEAVGNGANPDDSMWRQAALYVHHSRDTWSLTARAELIEFLGELPLSEAGEVIEEDILSFQSYTLTYARTVAELSELRFEVRGDSTNEKFYMRDNSVDNLVNNQTTYSVAWLMKF
jgi:hypothetical protein